MLIFHGFGGNDVGMERSTGFSQLADQEDFIAVYPQGLPHGDGGKPFWADVGPIDYGIDDALFVSDVLNDLQAKFCVDSRRIYATGFSNGGGMTNLLACRLAGRIAAFAPVSGDFYAIPAGCHPGRPVPILDFHGTADPVLPYNGISINMNPAWPLPAIPRWLQDWAARDSCAHAPATFLRESRITGEQWTGCQGNAIVVHYRIEGGGHAWPPPIGGRSGAAVIWSFFQSHPLPGSG
jgi:polyhydroxybutyrate depolymerase